MDLMWKLFFILMSLAILALLLLVVYMYVTTIPKPNNTRLKDEKSFTDPSSNKKVLFPSILHHPTVDLSVVVPAYNETERLPAMLNEATEYLENKQKENPRYKYEIIVVDDGSKDETSSVALLYSEKYGTDKVRVLTLVKNRGKGGAVKMGVLSSRGKLILFADADGATKFEDLEKLEVEMTKCLKNHDDVVVCGSRAHLEDEAIAERSMFRTLLMKGFHFLVWFLCVRGVKDTQCGFKLLSRSAAAALFVSLHVERWAFDVELLYIAQCLGMQLREVAVRWQEIEGSKIVPFWSWAQMGRDLLFIRLRYTFSLWKISDGKLD